MISTHIKYRSDIDGLRAIAVLSVIIFHINAKWIPGGFLGVDIFFVISGYLITLILTKEVKATNKINIVNFYKRRIKRIIPALLFVLIPTFIVGFLLFAPDDLLALSKSMIWAFFSAANIYFFSSIDTGYFATGSSELPLLHLWSLGVEEQFYILWPFAVLYLLRYLGSIKKQILVTSILFICSLIWAQSIIVTDHSFAYYMLPTRAWELLAGAMVALLVHSGFRTKTYISEIMAFLGLLVIILSLIFVTESDPVPGVAALPVILGVVLLILSGTSYQTYVGRILSLKIFVAVGLVSYSAYLWHWPVLAYLRYALIEIDMTIAMAVIFFTFTMATVSYFLVETPLRKNDVSTKNVFLLYFIVPAIIIVTVSTVTIQAIKHKSNWIFPWEQLSKINSNILSTSSYKYSCNYSNNKIYIENHCIYPENIDKADAFLIGDSNAAHYLGILRVFAEHYGFSIRNATLNSCPLVFDGEFDWIVHRKRKICSMYRHSVEEEASQYNTVFIGGLWNKYYSKEEFNESFKKTIDQLSKNVKRIVLLAQVPLFSKYNKECEIRSIRLNNLNCSNRFNNRNKEYDSNKYLRNLAKEYNNVDFFNIRNSVCQDKECSPYLDNNPVYYNRAHLSMKGSERIGNKMIDEKDPALHIFNHLKNMKQSYTTPILTIIIKDTFIEFKVNPKSSDTKIAFYLYKDDKHIDTKWYSKEFFYKIEKNKYGPGKYKTRYFIVDDNITNPGKNEKKEIGYSKVIEID